MTPVFAVRDVTSWEVVNAEPLGRDRKVWLRELDGSQDSGSRERDWLYKPVVVPAHGRPQGEDWAEKIVSELGRLFGVPCADVDLAERGGTAGSISRNVIPDGWSLVLGSVLMGTVLPNYQEGRLDPPGRPGHNPSLIIKAFREQKCGPVAGFEHLTASETFAGYLVLDAWVANQDRHDQNWAVMRSESGELRLAPSYDHASSLGFSLLDEVRESRLEPGVLRRWAERGRANRFEHDPNLPRSHVPTLVATANGALALASDRARSYWLDRLDGIEQATIEDVVRGTPKLSGLTRRFILELLEVNRRRLLDDD